MFKTAEAFVKAYLRFLVSVTARKKKRKKKSRELNGDDDDDDDAFHTK